MFSPLLSILFAFLSSGGGTITSLCEQSSVSPIAKSITAGDSWVISCLDSWSAGNVYHYVPRSSVTVNPTCNSSGSYTISSDVFTNNYTWVRTQLTLVPVNWSCSDPAKSFDSTFQLAVGNVASSPTFWTLLGVGISAGLFLGSIALGIGAISRVIDQQKGDND